MSTFLNFLKILVIVYVIVLVLMYFFQDRLIFFAQPINNPYVALFSEYEINFNHNGIALHGWFVKKDLSGESPLIIYYGGNAEEVSVNLSDLDRMPRASFLFVNYRGYGNSQGKPTEENLVNDALFVFDTFVKREGVDPNNIILMGRSLGSGVAIQIAAKRKIGGIILVTPFDSLVNVAKSHYPFFPVGLAVKHRFDSIKYASEIRSPTLALMGTSDRVIPNKHSKKLVEAWVGSITVTSIEGAGHNDIQEFPEYWSSIGDFVKELNE